MTYRLIRSARKTFAMEMGPYGLIVRVPYRATAKQIEKFIRDHEAWIQAREEKLSRAMKAQKGPEKLTTEDIRSLAEKARQVIPVRTAYYANMLGVTYGRITIRKQKTRWGSCSAKGNLNFNCLLMLAPTEVLDSVIIHELCHRKEMNHSQRFYAEVLRVFPEYRKWNKWLKENGAAIMSRASDI
jgi:predicted metal-dependent hydrolase